MSIDIYDKSSYNIVVNTNNKGALLMEIAIPSTKEQREFETSIKYLIQILSELPKEEVNKVIDFAVFLANE